MRPILCSMVLVVLVFTACHRSSETQDEPAFDALGSSQPSEHFGFPFWNEQAQKKTPLWGKALEYCQQSDHQSLINCQAVLAVAAPRIPYSTTMPPNGPGSWNPQGEKH